jgi:hypothetical protein
VRRRGDINAIEPPGAQHAHKTLRTQTSNTQRSQQHKHNLANHRSLKSTLLQAETQKTSEKQPFTHSCSKKNSKGIPKARPSANMRTRFSNIHESTRRFNAASPKNTKEHYHYTTPTNEPQPRVAIQDSTEHVIQGLSKEQEHTEVKFCGIVIPNGNGKKFPKYRFQPTLESAFQHGKIEELVEEASLLSRFL